MAAEGGARQPNVRQRRLDARTFDDVASNLVPPVAMPEPCQTFASISDSGFQRSVRSRQWRFSDPLLWCAFGSPAEKCRVATRQASCQVGDAAFGEDDSVEEVLISNGAAQNLWMGVVQSGGRRRRDSKTRALVSSGDVPVHKRVLAQTISQDTSQHLRLPAVQTSGPARCVDSGAHVCSDAEDRCTQGMVALQDSDTEFSEFVEMGSDGMLMEQGTFCDEHPAERALRETEWDVDIGGCTQCVPGTSRVCDESLGLLAEAVETHAVAPLLPSRSRSPYASIEGFFASDDILPDGTYVDGAGGSHYHRDARVGMHRQISGCNCHICCGLPSPAEREVLLHIYDVGTRATALNKVLRAMGTGAFHIAVEVYSEEYSFAFTEDDTTGVVSCKPRECEGHVYRESLSMGRTSLTERDTRLLLRRLSRAWPGHSYDVMRRNCCHFCDELCFELGVDSIPAWVKNMAEAWSALDRGVKSLRGVAGSLMCANTKPEDPSTEALAHEPVLLCHQCLDTSTT